MLEARSIAAAAATQPLPAARLAAWLAASAATVMVAFMSALLCSMIWYALARKVWRIERAEVAYRLEI